MLKNVRLMWAAAAMVSFTATAAFAQGPVDRRTYFTFNTTVEVPGATLPAGRYIFRLPSPDTSHSVVQVTSADGKKVYSTFFSLPSNRPEAASDPEVRFMETPAGAPRAVRTWWFPGERTGSEFVYPKAQAQRLAKATNQPVLSQARATAPENTTAQDLTRVSPAGEESQAAPDAAAVAPTGPAFQGQVASAETAPFNPASQSTNQGRRTRLPSTATSNPAIALAGLMALLGGAVLFGWRHRGEGAV
jgi:LPXTG-motif cell wall-anchored protein